MGLYQASFYEMGNPVETVSAPVAPATEVPEEIIAE